MLQFGITGLVNCQTQKDIEALPYFQHMALNWLKIEALAKAVGLLAGIDRNNDVNDEWDMLCESVLIWASDARRASLEEESVE